VKVYIIRASFSQERMTYLPEDSRVIYQSKDAQKEKALDALEWLAAMSSHVPDKGSRWSGIMDTTVNTTVMLPEGNGSNKTRMNGYHASSSWKDHPRNIEKIGRA